jgi:16S rRNA processing protein RimM
MMPPAEGWTQMVLVGFIARTHGNKGEVILNSESDFPALRFRAGARLYGRKEGREGQGPIVQVDVTTARFHQGRPVLGIAGVTSISDAERLVGLALKVPSGEQAPLPKGRYYHHELVGCEVVTGALERVGIVREVQGEGAATRLVVQGTRGEVLIPLAEEFCAVDVAAKRIVVTPPEGLLDVNGEWRT